MLFVWLKHTCTIPTYEIFPENYNVYRKDQNLDGGGVAIAVKDNLASLPCPNLDSDSEIIWTQILLASGKTFVVGCYYRVPESRVEEWKHLDASLDKIPQDNSSTPHVVLTGDFNAKTINWEEGIQTANSSEMRLVDIANKHFLNTACPGANSYHRLPPTSWIYFLTRFLTAPILMVFARTWTNANRNFIKVTRRLRRWTTTGINWKTDFIRWRKLSSLQSCHQHATTCHGFYTKI